MILRNENVIIEMKLFHENLHLKIITGFHKLETHAADEVFIKQLPPRFNGRILPIGYFEAR